MNKEQNKNTMQKILILVKGCEFSEKLKNALDYSGIINMIDEVKEKITGLKPLTVIREFLKY